MSGTDQGIDSKAEPGGTQGWPERWVPELDVKKLLTLVSHSQIVLSLRQSKNRILADE